MVIREEQKKRIKRTLIDEHRGFIKFIAIRIEK
jgi:hypothetical protein